MTEIDRIKTAVLFGSILPTVMIASYLIGAFIHWEFLWFCYENLFTETTDCSIYSPVIRGLIAVFGAGFIMSYLGDKFLK